jgi:hypothetical protein
MYSPNYFFYWFKCFYRVCPNLLSHPEYLRQYLSNDSQSGHIRHVKGRKGFLKFLKFACRLGIFNRAIVFSIFKCFELTVLILLHMLISNCYLS